MTPEESSTVIRNLMEGMTRKELYRRTNIREFTLRNYMTGIGSPPLNKFCKILDALGYEIDIREKRK